MLRKGYTSRILQRHLRSVRWLHADRCEKGALSLTRRMRRVGCTKNFRFVGCCKLISLVLVCVSELSRLANHPTLFTHPHAHWLQLTLLWKARRKKRKTERSWYSCNCHKKTWEDVLVVLFFSVEFVIYVFIYFYWGSFVDLLRLLIVLNKTDSWWEALSCVFLCFFGVGGWGGGGYTFNTCTTQK